MKRILPILLAAILLAIPIAACSSGNESDTSKEDQEAPITDDVAEEEMEPIVANLIQFEEVKEGMPVAKIKTTMGDVEIMLFPEQAPYAVENFIGHAESGYYNGVIFHRVIDGFMAQGGDPTGTGMGGESIYKDEEGNVLNFPDEYSNDLYMFRGSLAMANSGPSTNSSQFFIAQSPDIFDAEGLRAQVEETDEEGNKKTEEEIVAEVEDMIKQKILRAGCPPNAVDKYGEVGGIPHLDRMHTIFGQVTSGMDIVDAIVAVEKDPTSDKPIEDILINEIEITYPKGGAPSVSETDESETIIDEKAE